MHKIGTQPRALIQSIEGAGVEGRAGGGLDPVNLARAGRANDIFSDPQLIRYTMLGGDLAVTFDSNGIVVLGEDRTTYLHEKLKIKGVPKLEWPGPIVEVPEPASLVLLAASLLGLAGWRKGRSLFG